MDENDTNNVSNSSTSTKNNSKPPRGPAPTGSNPYTQSKKIISNPNNPNNNPTIQIQSNNNSNNSFDSTNRITTPPRMAGDPGLIAVDNNFAHENWDDDLDSPKHKNNNNNNNNNEAKTTQNNGNKNKNNGSHVKADENWLDDNFDD